MNLLSFWSKPAFKYGVCAALLLFYASVLWMAYNPNVSSVYKAYFIDQTSSCYHENPAASIAPWGQIRFGLGRTHQSCTTLTEGWDWQQSWGTWSLAPFSKITFILHSDAHQVADLLFHVIGFAPLENQSAWVFVNGAFAKEWELPHEKQTTFQLQIPIHEAHEAIELTFYFTNPMALSWFDKATNRTDQRLLSMGLLGFQWIDPLEDIGEF